MKLAIVGTRNYCDYKSFKVHLKNFIGDQKIDCIISGGAQGADSLAARYARKKHIELIVYPAKWKKYGRAAGPIRNKKIVQSADHILAFPTGPSSKGTYSTINIADQMKKPVTIINI
jgi:predicted Rossmann fold nucleotide-binding protein DprA/Smf involved in DNA uptake